MTESRRRPSYRGPLKAVIFDWAGTVIDYGSRAPVLAVMRTFDDCGVPVTEAEARGPMGMAKRDHLRTMLEMPRIAAQWQEVHGRAPDEGAVDKIYARFLKTQSQLLADHAELIPGCLEILAECRRRNLKIGSSTGYTRELMDLVMPRAAEQGFKPDAMLCASDVEEGRPAPWMCFENARRLGVYPMEALLKVDDTVVGVQAGLNAGMWSVGISKSGNLVGLSQPELANLAAADRQRRIAAAVEQLDQCGAHYVVDSVAELPPILDAIAERLERGEHPVAGG